MLLPTFSTAPSLQLARAAQLLILVSQPKSSPLASDGTIAQAAHVGVSEVSSGNPSALHKARFCAWLLTQTRILLSLLLPNRTFPQSASKATKYEKVCFILLFSILDGSHHHSTHMLGMPALRDVTNLCHVVVSVFHPFPQENKKLRGGVHLLSSRCSTRMLGQESAKTS